MKERREKVIFVNRYFAPDYSATAQILSDLAFHTALNGLRVVVITTSGLYDDHRQRLAESQLLDGVEIRRIYRPRFSRHQLIGRAIDYIFMHLSFAKALLRIVGDGDVVVVKTDPPLLSILLVAVARAKKARVINWLQDIFPEVAEATRSPFGRILVMLFAPIRDLTLKKSYMNVVIGERQKSFLLNRGIEPERVQEISNWCDDDVIRPAYHKPNALRSTWSLEGKFIVGYSGNLGRAHECETIINTARKFRHRRDVVFLFIGGGALLPQLKRSLEKEHLQALFQFEPYQPSDSLRVSLTLPDIHWISLRPEMEGLMLPSKFYGICAAGRPVVFIGDSANELANLIRENDCGVVVENGDHEKLADVIVELMDDREKVERLGLNARALLDTRFSRKHALERWTAVLRSALEGVMYFWEAAV